MDHRYPTGQNICSYRQPTEVATRCYRQSQLITAIPGHLVGSSRQGAGLEAPDHPTVHVQHDQLTMNGLG